MTVRFRANDHKYESTNPEDKIDWISVTTFVGLFKQKFDPIAQSIKSSKNPRSKWYKMKPEDIQKAWSDEADRAVNLGTWYHNQRESDLISFDTIERQGVNIPIIKPIMDGDLKLAPDQSLVEGIYPEHFVYLKSAGICGQSDRVEVVKDTVSVFDYKTNKKIDKESFKNWEGQSKMMTGPCQHLEDCNFNHYSLQLSTYLYIILKHNPRYKAGKLELHHITFEEQGTDDYGYPIAKRDLSGNPIVKEVVPYEVPYLKTEVIAMINWLQDNRDKIKKK